MLFAAPRLRSLRGEQTPGGGIDEVNTKTTLLTLPVLSAALLTGCTVTTGSSSRAVRVADGQCSAAESKLRRSQEELQLAEERADLERQRREFAEERLKKLREKTGKPKTAKPDEVENKPSHGS